MIRWAARMPFRMQLTLWWTLAFGLLLAVANLAIYTRLRRLPRARPGPKGAHRRRHRTGIVDRRGRHPPASASQGRRSQKASSPTPSCKFSLSMARVRLASPAIQHLPPLVGHDQVQAALDGRAPLVSLVVDGRPGRAAVLRADVGGQRYAVMVGLYRDAIEAHLSRLAWVLVLVWVAGLGDDLRARLLAGVEGAGAGRRDFAARRTDRAWRLRRAGWIHRSGRTRSAR